MKDKDIICIMADYGMAAYAWLRSPEENPTLVGGCIADAVIGFEESFGIPQDLQSEFAAWSCDFSQNSGGMEFDWKRWNERGLELARRLKRIVGDRYFVEYHVPMEDPSNPDGEAVVKLNE